MPKRKVKLTEIEPKEGPLPKARTTKQASLADKLRKKHDPGVDTAPHLVVGARAGTGKTTTLVEGLKLLKGTFVSLTPSPQQKMVWDAMYLSNNKSETVCFVAFNKSIATELKNRVPENCDAMTMHSLGLKAITRAFDRVKINNYRVQDIISELMEKDIRELRKYKFDMIKAMEDLVALCKQCLTDTTDPEALGELASYYDIDVNGNRREIFDLVPQILDRCKDVNRDRCIDFNDMIWLPVALDLNVYKYDVLLVDEVQDLNRCQQQLALKAGRRLILCGDEKQAIYGFAGADTESIPRMTTILSQLDRGCVTLPLTVTRRCGKAIVAEANKIVPDFEAYESNPEGKVYEMTDKEYTTFVGDGDMLICRINAPLVSQCFRFLKVGRKAYIQGRDIGQGLIKTIKKLKPIDIPDLIFKLSDWYHGECRKENAKRNPSENKLIMFQDRKECLECFCSDAKTVEEVTSKIERIFTDTETTGIRLSSIHKAKGLEAKRVFFLMPKGGECPHPMAKSKWQKEQENNLLYVGITRAIEELIYVR